MSKPPENVSIPAFLSKLWLLVEDKDTDPYIKWSDAGDSFIVFEPTQFSKEILPKHFKHNNMTSFVRQLNMYGFRKKFHPEQGGLIKNEGADNIEFEHQHFLRENQKLLALIKRKITNKDDIRLRAEGVEHILSDVKQVKTKQEHISGKLENIQRENDALWREVQYLRKRHEQQQKIVSRLIQFLITLVQNKNPLKRQQYPMIGGGDDASSAKYSKQSDDYAETYHTPTLSASGQPHSSGATLSEVEDMPSPMVDSPSPVVDLPSPVAAEPLAELLNPEMLDVMVAEAPPDIDLVLRDENNFPIVTSPEGTEIISGTSADRDTGQQIVPAESSPAERLEIMPVYQTSESPRPVLGRPLSIEEQRDTIGEDVTGIQGNLDAIQNLLEHSPKLSIENIWEIFRPDYNPNSQDFLSSLVSQNALSTANMLPPESAPPSSSRGTALVQYQQANPDNSFPSTIFSEEDENSLLTSLDEDARNLISSDSTDKDKNSSRS